MQLKDKIRERLVETIEGVDKKKLEYAMISISSIQIDKHLSPIVIQNNLGELKYGIGTDVDLNADLVGKDKVRARIRFAEYIDRVRHQPAGPRGYACEGMMAGIFGGTTEEDESSKTDIYINNKPYQVKAAEGSSWDSGSLLTEFRQAVNKMESDGVVNEWYKEIGAVDGRVINNNLYIYLRVVILLNTGK